MVFPAFGRAAALFSGGEGTWPANRRRFYDEFLMNAVTNVVLRSGPVAKRWELSLVLPNRRDRQVAARAGILRSLSTGQAMNRLCVYRIY
jgi:hypothetical protein